MRCSRTSACGIVPARHHDADRRDARVLDHGFDAIKLFPAAPGGIGMLKSDQRPAAASALCPTGGVDIRNARVSGFAECGLRGRIVVSAGEFDRSEGLGRD